MDYPNLERITAAASSMRPLLCNFFIASLCRVWVRLTGCAVPDLTTFGTLTTRFSTMGLVAFIFRNSAALILDMDYWSVAYLTPVKQEEIARTGTADKRLVSVNFTLVARNPGASAKVTDLS